MGCGKSKIKQISLNSGNDFGSERVQEEWVESAGEKWRQAARSVVHQNKNLEELRVPRIPRVEELILQSRGEELILEPADESRVPSLEDSTSSDWIGLEQGLDTVTSSRLLDRIPSSDLGESLDCRQR